LCCRYLHRFELMRQAQEKDDNSGHWTNRKATSSNRVNSTTSLSPIVTVSNYSQLFIRFTNIVNGHPPRSLHRDHCTDARLHCNIGIVNFDHSLVVTITVACYLWTPSTDDNFIYMCRHLQAATLVESQSIRTYATGMADTQDWQFETCWTTQELRMSIKYARKLSFFIMWLLYVQPLGGQNRYRLVWPVMIIQLELPISDKARNDAHIASTGLQLH